MSYKPTVAILGTSGFLGQPVIDGFHSQHLNDKILFPVKALTHDISKKPSDDDKVAYVQAILDDEHKDAVAEELKGTDVVISLLPPDPKIFEVVEWILKEIKPKVYFPSQFGTDAVNSEKVLPGFLAVKTDHSKAVRDSGIKVVDVFSSFFAVPQGFLYEVVGHVGIDTEAKTVTYAGSPDNTIAFSTLPDIGLTVATLASLPPSDIPDTVRIQSGEISFKEIATRYEADHNVTLTVKHSSSEQVLEEGKKALAKNELGAKEFMVGLFAIAAQGRDHGASYSKNDDELVNPGGKYWTWGNF